MPQTYIRTGRPETSKSSFCPLNVEVMRCVTMMSPTSKYVNCTDWRGSLRQRQGRLAVGLLGRVRAAAAAVLVAPNVLGAGLVLETRRAAVYHRNSGRIAFRRDDQDGLGDLEIGEVALVAVLGPKRRRWGDLVRLGGATRKPERDRLLIDPDQL